jgi:hypothetical protein
MNEQNFEIIPPGKLANLFPLFMGVVLPLILLGVLGIATQGSGEWRSAARAIVLLPLVAGILAWSMHHRKLRLSDAGLKVRWFPWSLVIPVAELDLDGARLVDLAREIELRPYLKLAGTRLPGFRSGWFWLRDRRRAYVVLTGDQRVLLLPKRDGQVCLFSLQRPEALLEALRRTAR